MPIKIKREVPEMERNNRVAMLAHLIEVLVISLLVFMQTAVGITSFAYAIIIFAIGMAPVIAEFIFWNKNHETNAIKHLVAMQCHIHNVARNSIISDKKWNIS